MRLDPVLFLLAGLAAFVQCKDDVANTLANRFWGRVAHTWTGQPIASEAFTAEGVPWDVFRLG